MNPMVSICCLAYNQKKYILFCALYTKLAVCNRMCYPEQSIGIIFRKRAFTL